MVTKPIKHSVIALRKKLDKRNGHNQECDTGNYAAYL